MHLVWFRQDLRIHDNPALYAASKLGPVVPVYIYEPTNQHLGGASKVWLHYALASLNDSLSKQLHLFEGHADAILLRLCQQYDITAVYWNRRYEPEQIKQDQAIERLLKQYGVSVTCFQSSLLSEPWQISKKDGSPYKVFTPYYRQLLSQLGEQSTLGAWSENMAVSTSLTGTKTLTELALLPDHPWAEQCRSHWDMSEQGANEMLMALIDKGLDSYQQQRDYPAQAATSTLSPYLHFGQISPRQIVQHLHTMTSEAHSQAFLRQLCWREFSYYLFYHNPDLATKPLQTQYNAFPWQWQNNHLSAWQEGVTGYPLIDAGMRQLWQTGYMHNRVRMLVASFLVKNLQIHWQQGQNWFWECLFDADRANNSAGWQWVAGCGADAAPFYRVFNPVLQAKKFDPKGEYIRHYVPELARLPDKYIAAPWLAPESVLQAAGITLGQDYPEPIVALDASREQALQAYRHMKTLTQAQAH